jgi:hypothetical protein
MLCDALLEIRGRESALGHSSLLLVFDKGDGKAKEGMVEECFHRVNSAGVNYQVLVGAKQFLELNESESDVFSFGLVK